MSKQYKGIPFEVGQRWRDTYNFHIWEVKETDGYWSLLRKYVNGERQPGLYPFHREDIKQCDIRLILENKND